MKTQEDLDIEALERELNKDNLGESNFNTNHPP